MKLRPFLAALLLGAAAALALPLAHADDAKKSDEAKKTDDAKKTYCWKLTKGSGEVYLLGSMHICPDDFYPLPKEIESAFKASHSLVVEADAEALQSDPQKMQAVLAKVKYEGEDSLAKHISAETKKKLDEYCEKAGLPAAALDAFKPAFAASQIQLFALQGLGWTSPGIDNHFLVKARKKNKKVLELESIEIQLDLLTGFSDAVAEKFLASTLKETGKTKETFEKILAAWKSGDLAAMDKITQDSEKEDPDSKEFQKKLLDDRNVKMAEKIDGYLKEKGPFFVVVGAAHLCGEVGLVKLLEKKGAKAEQVTAKEQPRKDDEDKGDKGDDKKADDSKGDKKGEKGGK